MFYTIYRTYNQINGKEYTGLHQSKKLINNYLGSGKLLLNALAKYGRDNFEKEILFVLKTEEEMYAKEAEIVTQEYCNRPDTYNLIVGGLGGFQHINNNKDMVEQNLQRSKDNLKLGTIAFSEKYHANSEFRSICNENSRLSLSKGRDKAKELYPEGVRKGSIQTEESRKKISDSNIGKQVLENNPNYGKMWITNGVLNLSIPKNDPIPDGFRKGMYIESLIGEKNPNYGKIPINNGVINRTINKNDIIPDGFKKGKLPNPNQGKKQIGSIWITNGLINKRIRNDDIIPDTFRRGKTHKSKG